LTSSPYAWIYFQQTQRDALEKNAIENYLPLHQAAKHLIPVKDAEQLLQQAKPRPNGSEGRTVYVQSRILSHLAKMGKPGEAVQLGWMQLILKKIYQRLQHLMYVDMHN